MKKALIILLLTTFNLKAQNPWINLLPGLQSMKSVSINDTIFTVGTGLLKTGNFFVCINKTNQNGVILKSDTLIINNDSSTGAFYSHVNNLVINENNKIELSCTIFEKIKSQYGHRSYIFNYPDFTETKYNINFDTSSTFVNQYGLINNTRYAIISVFKTINTSSTVESWYLMRFTEDTFKIIVKQVNSAICSNCHNPVFTNFKEDNKNKSNLFLNVMDQWDFHGVPAQFQNDIVKMDTNGNIIWKCRPNKNDSFNTSYFQFTQKSNGNLLCVWTNLYYTPYKGPRNYMYEDYNEDNTLCFTEIDYITGQVLWTKKLKKYLDNKVLNGDTAFGQDILIKDIQIIDNQYAILGGDRTVYFNSSPSWEDKNNILLLKTDLLANPIWYREHSIYPNDTGDKGAQVYSILNLNDKGYLLTGEYLNTGGQLSNGEMIQKGILIKLDSFGCLTKECEKKDNIVNVFKKDNKISIYPNPSNSPTFYIKGIIQTPFNISIINSLGQVVFEQNEQTSRHISTNLKSGIYTIKIYTSDNIALLKWLIE